MSTFDKNVILLGGHSDDPNDHFEDVFVLDTSQFEFPLEYVPTLRNDSLRSVTSEPALQQIPFSSDPRFQTWSGPVHSESPTPVTPATPTHSPSRQFSIPIASSQPLRFPAQALNGTYEPEFRRNESVSPPSIFTQRRSESSILPSETLTLGSISPVRQEGTFAPGSIDTAFQWRPPSHSPKLPHATPLSPLPTNNTISTWLNASLEEDSVPPFWLYTPPGQVYDWTLLQFLNKDCKELSQRFKIKSTTEPAPERDSHLSIGTGNDCIYQRTIDSGTNSDVFQVTTDPRTLSYNRCITRNGTRYDYSRESINMLRSLRERCFVITSSRNNGAYIAIWKMKPGSWKNSTKMEGMKILSRSYILGGSTPARSGSTSIWNHV